MVEVCNKKCETSVQLIAKKKNTWRYAENLDLAETSKKRGYDSKDWAPWAQTFEQPGLLEGDPGHGKRAGTRWYLWSLTTQTILWFYDSRMYVVAI